jgi:hypothetical protein
MKKDVPVRTPETPRVTVPVLFAVSFATAPAI